MKEVMVFLVLAIASYLFRRFCIWLGKDSFIGAKETTGIIKKIFDDEGGIINYQIIFVTDDGEQLKGESVGYSSTKGKYRTNDLLPIKYVIGKKGYVMVVVLDDELVPCSDAVKKAARNMLIATVVFLIIAAVLFVKNILL